MLKLKGISSSDVYYYFLFALIVMLPLSLFGNSVSQFALGISWFFVKDLKGRFLSFFKNPLAIILTSLFVIHLLGIFYSTDTVSAWRDIRIKIPLFTVPFFLSTGPKFSKKKIEYILIGFVAATVASITWACLKLGLSKMDIIPRFDNIRDVTIVSHIRLSMMISFSIGVLCYFLFKTEENKKRLLIIFTMLYCLAFIAIIGSITGFVILFILSFIIVLFYRKKLKKSILIASYLVSFTAIATAISIIGFELNMYYSGEKIQIESLDQKTAQGNSYKHKISAFKENGNPTWIYFCEKELISSWREVSSIKYWGKDNVGQKIKYTLIRYLTSLGYRKDAEGVKKLTAEDITNIENGIPNYRFTKISGINKRIYETIWELDRYFHDGNPSGHSIAQRLEYMFFGFKIIKKSPFFGVGTGDVKNAYQAQYENSNTKLSEKWRLGAHNQFISITIAFGIVGLIWFLFVFFSPFIYAKIALKFLFLCCFIILFLSMFIDDTMETQAGVTFFIAIPCLLIFANQETSIKMLSRNQ